MDTRHWLTNNHSTVADGHLSAVCVRLFAVWGLLSAPLLTAAAVIWAKLTPDFIWISFVLLGVACWLYIHLVMQGVRVFRSAGTKSVDSTLFLVLQTAVCSVFVLAFWGERRHLHDIWSMLGFAFSAITLFLDLTFIIIGLAARQRIVMTMWAGFAAALASCGLFVRTGLLS